MPKRIDYTPNTRFEGTRLTFLGELESATQRKARFLCDCGNTIDRFIAHVRHKTVTSCGCFRKEVVAQKNTKHGQAVRDSKSGAYRSWQAMQQRAGKGKSYENVTVCQEWTGEEGFSTFVKELGERPEGMTLERIDGSKGYESGNCKWATRLEQAQNLSTNVNVTLNGETHSINEWCRIKGIGYALVKQRRKRGMTVEDAISQPVDMTKSFKKKGLEHASNQ